MSPRMPGQRRKMTRWEREEYEQRRNDRIAARALDGGLATKAKYANASGDASGYYSAIGKLGFEQTCERHYNGNRAQTVAALRIMNDPHRNVAQPGAFRQLRIFIERPASLR